MTGAEPDNGRSAAGTGGYGRRLAALIAVCMLAPMARGAAQPRPEYSSWWLPEAATDIAGRIDGLFGLILWITLFFLALVTVALVVIVIRYRERTGRQALYTHGSDRIELLWAAIPAAVLIVIAIASNSIWSRMTEAMPSEAESFVVLVKPRQFQWDVVYAGLDGAFGTADDITAINVLRVPAARDVVVRLAAQDVIHSFFVPEFRVKQDAVPGMVTRTWFNVPVPGRYEIACAELCGLGHYRMRGALIVMPPNEFRSWLDSAGRASGAGLAR